MYGGVSSLGKISRPLHDTYQDINRLLTGVLDPTSFFTYIPFFTYLLLQGFIRENGGLCNRAGLTL
jgi:hypothetical protein